MRHYFDVIRDNIISDRWFYLTITIYSVLVLSQITWGIPAEYSERVFLYHMDEWHQFSSLLNLKNHGSSNIEASANGPILFFLMSGAAIAPAIVTGLIDTTTMTSPVDGLAVQSIIFSYLRVTTLLFGVGTLFVFYQSSVFLFGRTTLSKGLSVLFALAPNFVLLSSYYKYDIAGIFWLSSCLGLLLFAVNKKNYIYPQRIRLGLYGAAAAGGCAIATKITLLPLLPLILLTWYLSTQRKLAVLIQVASILIVTTVLLGFGDLLLNTTSLYQEFFKVNLLDNPNLVDSYQLSKHWFEFLLLDLYPLNFGWGLWLATSLTIPLLLLSILFSSFRKKGSAEKIIAAGLALFFVSLLPLKLFATGNRSLVYLPFILLALGFVLNYLSQKKHFLIISIIVLFQLPHLFGLLQLKWQTDPRAIPSNIFTASISEVSIEPQPIYQMLPDPVTYSYNYSQYHFDKKSRYVPLTSLDDLEQTVIVTNTSVAQFQNNTKKILLLETLEKHNYTLIESFEPSLRILSLISSREALSVSPQLVPQPLDIKIYGTQQPNNNSEQQPLPIP